MAISDDYFGSLDSEIARMMRFHELISLSAQQLVERETGLARLVSGSAVELQRIATQIAQSRSMAAAVRGAEEAVRMNPPARLAEFSRAIEEASRSWFDPIRSALARFDTASAFADELTGISRVVSEVADLSKLDAQTRSQIEIAGGVLHERLATLEVAASDTERNELLPLVLEALLAWIRSLPRGLPWMTVLPTVLAILSLALVVDGRVTDAEWRASQSARDQQVDAVLGDIATELSALTHGTAERPLFRTSQPRPVRVAPHAEADRLGTVPIDGLVERLDEYGRWRHVVFLDPDAGIPVVGWIFNRGLIEVGQEPEGKR